MDCSTPGFPVLHYHLEFPRIHVHWVRDATPVSFCHQSFPASESFPMSWLFALGGQITGASASVLPVNIQSWFPLGLTNLISLQSKGLSRVFSNITVQKASILQCSAFFMLQLSHPYMTTGKTTALTIQTCVGKVMSLLFNRLSRFIIAFLPRSKCLLVSWLQSPPAQENKTWHCFHFSPPICHEVMGPDSWCRGRHSPFPMTNCPKSQINTLKQLGDYRIRTKSSGEISSKYKDLRKHSYCTFVKANLWKPQIICIYQIPHASLNVTSHFSSKLTTTLLQIKYFLLRKILLITLQSNWTFLARVKILN